MNRTAHLNSSLKKLAHGMQKRLTSPALELHQSLRSRITWQSTVPSTNTRNRPLNIPQAQLAPSVFGSDSSHIWRQKAWRVVFTRLVGLARERRDTALPRRGPGGFRVCTDLCGARSAVRRHRRVTGKAEYSADIPSRQRRSRPRNSVLSRRLACAICCRRPRRLLAVIRQRVRVSVR